MAKIAGMHHECLNGMGYPKKLKSLEIPLVVQIVTVCDIYQALIAERPYKPALPMVIAFTKLYELAAEGAVNIEVVRVLERIQIKIRNVDSDRKIDAVSGEKTRVVTFRLSIDQFEQLGGIADREHLSHGTMSRRIVLDHIGQGGV